MKQIFVMIDNKGNLKPEELVLSIIIKPIFAFVSKTQSCLA